MKPVTVLSSNRKTIKELCDLLKKNGYKTYKVFSIVELKQTLEHFESLTVVIDIDAIPITNSFIKELTKSFPEIKILCLSESKFHPDLQDIISQYIFACLSKPIDSEELFYWLESIEKDEGPPNKGGKSFGA